MKVTPTKVTISGEIMSNSNNTALNALSIKLAELKAQNEAKTGSIANAGVLAQRRRTHEEHQAYLEEYRRGVEARKAERAAKKAEKLAALAQKVPGQETVIKRAAGLPELSEDAARIVDAAKECDPAELAAIVAHLNHHRNAEALLTATKANVSVGDWVRVIGGDPKHIGKEGIVTQARRVRVFVDVGESKEVYVYASEVEKIEDKLEIEIERKNQRALRGPRPFNLLFFVGLNDKTPVRAFSSSLIIHVRS